MEKCSLKQLKFCRKGVGNTKLLIVFLGKVKLLIVPLTFSAPFFLPPICCNQIVLNSTICLLPRQHIEGAKGLGAKSIMVDRQNTDISNKFLKL